MVKKSDINNIIDIFNKIGQSECEITTVIKIFLITVLITMLLALMLPIIHCLITGVVIFIILYIAVLLNIIC